MNRLTPVTLPVAVKARNEAELNRVIAADDHDRDGSCGRLGSKRGQRRERGEHIYLALDQLGRQFRHLIIVTPSPPILDADVLAVDVAGFVQAAPERSTKCAKASGEAVFKKPITGSPAAAPAPSAANQPPRHRAA